jgi:hypothetical protein
MPGKPFGAKGFRRSVDRIGGSEAARGRFARLRDRGVDVECKHAPQISLVTNPLRRATRNRSRRRRILGKIV